MSRRLIDELMGSFESQGFELTPRGAEIMLADLSHFHEGLVIDAIARCRRELSRRMTTADIISRLEDGRPGPQEAWAKISVCHDNEHVSVCTTNEVMQAWSVCGGDGFAFREAYQRIVADNRAKGTLPEVHLSLGWDKNGREGAVREAAALKAISHERMVALLPQPEAERGEMAQITQHQGELGT